MDRDPGDYYSPEVRPVCDVWHPSFIPAKPKPTPSSPPTPTGRQSLQEVLAVCRARRAMEPLRAPEPPRTGWRDSPEQFRRLVARSAGLPEDVVGKLDRDLTESEKALIRAAAKRLMERASALFSL